jgi:hypothetical protein
MTDDTTETAPAENQAAKPANLPDKFWDAENSQVRLDALTSSYLALEKKLSAQAIPSLDTEDGKKKMRKAMGVPDSPDGYVIDVSHGMFEADPAVNQKLHQLGFSPTQAQAVYDLAAQKLVPLILQISNEYKADGEVQKLVSQFGGPDKWMEVSRQLLAYGKKNLPADVLRSLSTSYEGVMALFKMMKNGDTPSLAGPAAAPDGPNAQDLQSMMRDPKYWKTKDPAHVAKVTEGFKKMYKS